MIKVILIVYESLTSHEAGELTKKEITVLQHVIRLSAHAACYFGRDFACEQSREAVLILLHLLVG